MGHPHLHGGAARPATEGEDVWQTQRLQGLWADRILHWAFLLPRPGRPLELRGLYCLSHPCAGANNATYRPDQDGSKYHTSAETNAFFAQQTARLQVFQLPTYSPDYNPIEKLWKKIKQQDTHLHYFPTFEALTEKVEQALLKFTNTPEEILRALRLADRISPGCLAAFVKQSFS